MRTQATQPHHVDLPEQAPATDLAQEYGVSVGVAWHALAMLAANRYVHQPGGFAAYTVTWRAALWCVPSVCWWRDSRFKVM